MLVSFRPEQEEGAVTIRGDRPIGPATEPGFLDDKISDAESRRDTWAKREGWADFYRDLYTAAAGEKPFPGDKEARKVHGLQKAVATLASKLGDFFSGKASEASIEAKVLREMSDRMRDFRDRTPREHRESGEAFDRMDRKSRTC